MKMKKKTIGIIAVSVLGAAAIFCSAMFTHQYLDAKNSKAAFDDLTNLIMEIDEPQKATEAEEADLSAEELAAAEAALAREKYAALFAQNNDFIGWIRIDGTNVNYPVMQTPNKPDFYLKRSFDKSYSDYGVPYIDEACMTGISNNLVIYGHHMNDGSMFADLCKYADADFCREHPTIAFDTLSSLGKYEVIAAFKFNTNRETFKYNEYTLMDEVQFELFGTCAKSITTRAIDADVGRLGVLCDRGKYIHPDYLVVDPSVIDTINDYIEASPRSLIPYGELFDALKEKFDGTQITNRFLLQGALKKYGCRFSTGRDFVRKTKSVTFVDELESFVSDRGIVHKSEIFAEFTSLGEAGLGQVVSRSANVFSIDNGYYIHAEQFDIQPEDYEMLRGYLSEACMRI